MRQPRMYLSGKPAMGKDQPVVPCGWLRKPTPSFTSLAVETQGTFHVAEIAVDPSRLPDLMQRVDDVARREVTGTIHGHEPHARCQIV
jgi:hypothetical protein